jgi:tripartite-type tricarboxylate transporter receptor subunit TctC
MAGRMDYDCVSLPLALPQIAGKTVKPIAILSKRRSSNLPDLPSAHEQGLTNFDLPSWYALFLPAKTPQPIIQRLNRATVAALEMPSLQQRLKQVGGDVIASERLRNTSHNFLPPKSRNGKARSKRVEFHSDRG